VDTLPLLHNGEANGARLDRRCKVYSQKRSQGALFATMRSLSCWDNTIACVRLVTGLSVRGHGFQSFWLEGKLHFSGMQILA
jgi:hypothetical protein